MNNEYYVSPQGNDTGSGTRTNPWRTIQNAADLVQAGDTVTVLAGRYSDDRIIINASGTAVAPIRFQTEGTVEIIGFLLTGDHLQISGFTVKLFNCAQSEPFRYGIEARGSHFLIENCRFIETLDAGVYTSPYTAQGIVRHNYFYHNIRSSIQLHGKNHLVEANTVRQPLQDHPVCHKRMADDADAIRYFGTGHILRGNDIRQIWYGEYVRDAHMDCFQTFRGHEEGDPEFTTNIILENNFCEANSFQTEDESGTAFTMENVGSSDGTFEHGIIIRNNIIMAPLALGIHGNTSFVSFINNTCIGNPAFIPHRTRAIDCWPEDSRYIQVQNNILQDYAEQFYIARTAMETGTIILQHNLSHRRDKQFSTGVYYECGKHGNLCADPAFSDPTREDFHLQPNSPAIGAGISLELAAVDFDGSSRHLGGVCTLGAYETTGSNN